ncbi:MAG TPA: selenide, water dikinase SelD [Caulobacteraceae bacterium]|jgi:selenide,water dikinase
MTEPVRLTSLAHGGGCGCKLPPAVLRDILSEMPLAGAFPDLLVGADTSDDAAVWRLNDEQALVATTDFFTPIVDDPSDFGRIAAANALSDIYAMGARPIFALAIVGMPMDKLPAEAIRAILAGGASVCAEAGVPVAGGHSIDSAEPIYGLVGLGLAHPQRVLTNAGARPGDLLILTKPLGVGVLSAALRQGRLDEAGYQALILSTTRLNTLGADLSDVEGLHAVTDVTGFGLLGHALEVCRASGVAAELSAEPPLLLRVETLAREGVRTGASGRNWTSYGEDVDLPGNFEAWRRDLLTDPQTSGGLLIAAGPDAAARVLEMAREQGFGGAAVVGRLAEGPARITVRRGLPFR